jgi:threonine aldolase
MSDAVADLRSDTVTLPSDAMKAAMVSAPLGDDVLGGDPTVRRLEERVAALLGKERALFVPSGTMANQLALRAHTQAGDEVIAHARSHVYAYESGAPAALAGVSLRLFDSLDGSLPPEGLAAAYRDGVDPHAAPTRLLALENTHNACGGVVVPEASVTHATDWARRHGLGTHLDGARIWNAAVASGVEPGRLATAFDTVSVCFSKGLGAPVGSALAGSEPLIRRAYRFRKMYGGGMRQSGILAAAALFALDHHVGRLAEDHARARAFAEHVASCSGLSVALERVHTNIVYFDVAADHPMGALDDAGRCRLVGELAARGVLVLGWGRSVRAVFHLDVDDEGLAAAISATTALT